MLNEILRFEWRYHSRQVVFVAASLLFSLLGFALGAGRFGADNVAVNSPYLVMEAFGLLSLIALIPAGIFASSAVLRDDDYRMSEIVHTTPIGKLRHLLGRFGGAFLATLSVAAFSGLGMATGALMPWLPPERVAAMDARPYLAAFGAVTVPNVLFATALLFAVAVLARNAIATYAAAVALYVLYFVCAALTNSPLMAGSRPGGGGGTLPSLLDPFALTGFFDVTRYWTAAEKNTRFIPFEGVLLLNRLIWIAMALGILALVYRRFSFRVRKAAVLPRKEPPRTSPARSQWRAIRPAGTSWLATYRSCTRLELRTLLTKSTLLLLLLWLGLAVSEIYGSVFTGEYNSTSYPATSLISRALQQPATILGTILILYYGAELFWREQRFRMASVVDSTPVSGAVMIASKWTALAALLGAMLLGGAAAGLALQVAKGYFDFQPFLYLSFFYFTGVPLLLYAAASLFIHALSPGKYAGMIFFVLFVIVSRRAAAFGLEHDLWRFAASPPVSYTELNGFGHYAAPFHWFMLHWMVLALLLAAMAAALWRRVAAPLKERLRVLTRPNRTARALVATFAVTGAWIFYNTNIAQSYVTTDEMLDWRTDYEKTYKKIEALPRPRILAVDGEVDLYPAEQRCRVAGRYTLANESTQPIPALYVATRREAGVTALSIPPARRTAKDDRFGMHRFDFQPPLAPGARAELRFDLSFEAKGFASGQQDDAVVGNGTFLMNLRAFPTLGYRESYELVDLRERRKRGLSGASTAALAENGAHGAVDPSTDEWIDLSLTVSTAGDQTALAPGRLESSWERGGRRWFRYRTGAPILNRFAIVSGRYAVAKRQQGPAGIELYYHPAHAANVAHMLDTAAASLDVMQSRFEPYPHRQLRIVEVSSYWPWAGYALPETVYLREDRAFLTDARDKDRPDLVARRVAHEVAHQWFGHRVQVADVEGASVIVESLTKYSELLVVERMRGREHVRQLLEIELDRYLSGRAEETYAEVPLYKADDQAYLFYNKAAVVLFALRDLLGQEAMDRALRALMRERRPTSVDLVRHLHAVADARQGALIDQWMRDIVLYDLRVDAAQAHRRADGRYDVIVRIGAGKSRADGHGNERPMALDEPIEIAIASDSNLLDSRRHVLRRGMNEIRLTVDSPPSSVTLDPWITRIDRNPQDNAKRF